MYFLDTGFIKDLLDEKDAHHDAAVRINNFVEENNIKVMINTSAHWADPPQSRKYHPIYL